MIYNWEKFLEKVGTIPISNIHSYIEGMELGYLDKLFFIDKIEPDVIVDFGCADGRILSKISKIKPNVKLIGYDLDNDMLQNAKQRLGRKSILTSDWNKVVLELKKYERPALILSSVIHEVYSYSHTHTIKKFWNEQVFGGDFKWICIRDMIPSVESHKKRKFMGDVMRVRNRANKEYLESFEKKWGKISNNYRTFMHYLLKYKYTDNWDREVNENYLPISLETLYTKIPSGYRIKYQDNYILPILQQQVKKDFDIVIDHTTHTKIIIENRTFRKYNKMNESKSHDDINFIEDIFLEYIDKYKMKHGKYLSDPSLQGENFDDNYPLWYTIYPSFDSKISRLYVPSDYYIELDIEARSWKGDIDKDSLFKDIDHFLNRIEKYGWKWVESSTCNKRTFLNENPKVGESYSPSLRYYLYKNNKVNESNTNQLTG